MSSTPFGPVQQINAHVLNTAYAGSDPAGSVQLFRDWIAAGYHASLKLGRRRGQ